MNLIESLKSALKSVLSNKSRAFLTMLGIIIGIGSVIIITSIGKGNQVSMTEQFSKMGVGRLIVRQMSRSSRSSEMLTLKDYDMLKKSEDIKFISGVYSLNGSTIKLYNPKETKNAEVTGVNGDYKEIMNPTLLYGRYITENDNDMKTKVAVINDTTAQKVFNMSNQNVIGKKIMVKTRNVTQKFTVVGITENSNASIENSYSSQYPESIVVPLTTAQAMAKTKQVSQLTVVVNDVDAINDIATDITNRLETFHGVTDAYYVQNTMQMMEQLSSVMGMVTTFISFVAGISLLVGGIGVMNIMLVTVTERTREIGIRKSIGAKKRHIMFQFLIEAIILTGLGGFFGVLFGYAGGNLVGSIVDVKAVFSMSSIALAVIISTSIGIIFGVYPANKAAKLNPIEALRYE